MSQTEKTSQNKTEHEAARVVGIDPGLTGAATMMNLEGKVEAYMKFPVTETKKPARKGSKGLFRIERTLNLEAMWPMFSVMGNMKIPCVAFLEKVHARPGEGTCSSFTFGECYGAIKMALHAFRVKYHEVTPEEWCKAMHIPGDKSPKAKKRSLNAFERVFATRLPAAKPSMALVDSALIAEYGRLRLLRMIDAGIQGA